LWWIQETDNEDNKWPYVFSLDDIYLFSDKSGQIAFDKIIQDKTSGEIAKEIEALLDGCIAIAELSLEAKRIDSQCPGFPFNGSISRLNSIYHELILNKRAGSLFAYFGADTESPDIQKALSDTVDEKNEEKSKEELLEEARNFTQSGESHKLTTKPVKIRIEDVAQKRRVAAIEDFTCQVCEFQCGYIDNKGKQRWVIEVDHIIDKSDGGGELLDNLWVLCPNCHAKKTRGIIKIDPSTKTVTENGISVLRRDNHLGWL